MRRADGVARRGKRRGARHPRPRRAIASRRRHRAHRARGAGRVGMSDVCRGARAPHPRTSAAARADDAGRRVPHPRARRHAVRPGLDAQAPEERRVRHAFADAARARHRSRRTSPASPPRTGSRPSSPSIARSATSIRGCTSWACAWARSSPRSSRSARSTRRATSCMLAPPVFIDGWATPWYRGLRPLLYVGARHRPHDEDRGRGSVRHQERAAARDRQGQVRARREFPLSSGCRSNASGRSTACARSS